MRKVVNTLRKATWLTGMTALVAWSGAATATPLALPDTPLFLSVGVQPNLIMAIDDSGSMDNEVLLPTNDGAAWWRTAASDSGNCTAATGNNFVGCIADGTTDQPGAGRLNFNNAGNSSGTWKKFVHLFPNGCDGSSTSAQRRLCDGTDDHFAIPPLPAFAWTRAYDHNSAYFNPATTYLPWPNGGGYTFADSSPTNARFDPVYNSAQVINLTRDVAGVGNADTTAACDNTTLPGINTNYYFHVYTGMTLPAGTCIRVSTRNWETVRTEGCAVGVNNGCYTREGTNDRQYRLNDNSSVAIRYFPATFYLTSAADLPAGYGYTGATLSGSAPDGSALIGYEIKPANFDTTAHYTAAIQNFANWFTYYRKRHQALRGGMGQSFAGLSGMRVAGFTISNNGTNVTVNDINVAANRTALYTNFYRDWTGNSGTPNRTAVSNIIRNFKRTDASAPVQYSCQKNFGILFTDGFSNPPAAGDGINGVAGNADGTAGAPYADNVTDTLADAVYTSYANPLRTGTGFPAGKVTVPTTCGAGTPGPSVDCNRNLHMNFYAVTLGTRGLLFNPDADPPQDPYATPTPTWPTTFPARHPSAVDDLWHATVNGRGQLLNAKSPHEISDKLSAVLRSIVEKTASASSASVNSGSINSDTRIYQAKFNSSSWTGQLLAYAIDPNTGRLVTPENWDASRLLPDAATRNIVTVNSNRAAVRFDWNSLDATRQGQLDPTPASPSATNQQLVLNYIRGDGSNEGTGAGRFRTRQDAVGPNKLGDIVSSSPLFVGRPNFRYRDSLESAPYSQFANDHVDRNGVVYVGANDGMLHAFDARDRADGGGVEIFAFIPSPVFPRLRNLASQSYSHQFYVDGPPSMGDVFYGNAWHTVLVGGLNKGGQGIYALDVTDPSALGPSSVLWEFTDANDADLGYTFSQPAIVRLHDGRWAAVFGNGYNSRSTTTDDTTASTTGRAVLYIVDIQTGALIRKFDTLQGTAEGAALGLGYDNGMSTPSLVDINNDRIVDFAYAGDLYGNMWKFDLSSTDPTAWKIAYGTSTAPQPLYAARDASGNPQPITVRPEVTRGPYGSGTVVLFGTGKYLEASDRTTTPTRVQTFYGIVDRNSGTDTDRVADRSSLVQQQVLVETTVSSPTGNLNVRVTSNNALGTRLGWYMDLLSPTSGYQAEKQVTNPIIRNGRVVFTTLIPDADPCGSGGGSWIMELNALDGSRLTTTPFDINNDSQFTTADNVTVTLPDGTRVTVPVSGLGSQEGILQSPGVIEGEVQGGLPVQFKYLPGSSGGIQRVTENPGAGGTGRQSWRQIR